jgi:hypothetical protein
MTYWYPRRALHSGHFAAWTWLFPPFWLILVPVYAGWVVALAVIFVLTIPVNVVRLVIGRAS